MPKAFMVGLSALLLALIVVDCGRTKALEIELDIFSGRPNPKWILTDAETTEVEKKLASLTVPADSPTLPGLGFRGYVINTSAGPARVLQGRVQRGGTWFSDTAALEETLKHSAAAHGFGGMLNK